MKLKYKFRVHHLMDSYPTSEDALFDIINFLRERNINTEEEWSDLGVKGAFQKKLSEDEISLLLQELTDEGFLQKREGAGKRNYYKILKNKF